MHNFQNPTPRVFTLGYYNDGALVVDSQHWGLAKALIRLKQLVQLGYQVQLGSVPRPTPAESAKYIVTTADGVRHPFQKLPDALQHLRTTAGAAMTVNEVAAPQFAPTLPPLPPPAK